MSAAPTPTPYLDELNPAQRDAVERPDGRTVKLTLPEDSVFEDRFPRLADIDGDGVGTRCDNCPNTVNPTQVDADNDTPLACT